MIWPDSDNKKLLSWENIDIDFTLKHVDILSMWMADIADDYEKCINNIHFLFCSDAYMLKINREQLHHDYYTDIITFPLREDELIEAEALISIDRVKENAEKRNIKFPDELHRVLIHAILHLAGLNDESEIERKIMRDAEDRALEKLKLIMPEY